MGWLVGLGWLGWSVVGWLDVGWLGWLVEPNSIGYRQESATGLHKLFRMMGAQNKKGKRTKEYIIKITYKMMHRAA